MRLIWDTLQQILIILVVRIVENAARFIIKHTLKDENGPTENFSAMILKMKVKKVRGK